MPPQDDNHETQSEGDAEILPVDIPNEIPAGPIDLESINRNLQAEDGITQGELHKSILHLRQEIHNEERWNATSLVNMSLSSFKRAFEAEDDAWFSKLLSRRIRIDVGDQLVIDVDGDDLVWNTSSHYLDYFMAVSLRIGLWAILPNARDDHTFLLRLDLKKPQKEFPCKYAKLNFDPTGKMLYIGQCQNEDVYLGMCPQDVLEPEDRDHAEDVEPGYHRGNTRLTRKRYNILVLFLARIFARLPQRAINTQDDQLDQVDVNSTTPNFNVYTNLMAQERLDLTLHEVRILNATMHRDWRDYVELLPQDWRKDNFFLTHVPISLTSRFGQNQPICGPNADHDRAATMWDHQRCYDDIDYVTFAVASDISAEVVLDWEAISRADLLRKLAGRRLYDHWDPDTRTRRTLRQTPLYDETGREIRLYTDDGRKFGRRKANIDNTSPPCGILMKLRDIDTIYNSNHNDAANNDVGIAVYPQAFLHQFGHVKATGILAPFYEILQNIQGEMGKRVVHDEERDEWDELDDEEQDVEDFTWYKKPVSGISSQIYNELSHRVAADAASHEVQQGQMAASLAGSYADTISGRNTYSRLSRDCDLGLPFKRFCDKIALPNCPRALRFEQVFYIDLKNVRSSKTSGRHIYNEIIRPLVDAWSLAYVVEAIKPHVLVLAPEAFPALYTWTARPIFLLLEEIWAEERAKRLTQRDAYRCSPYILELVSALERSLAFAVGGNAKVLSKRVMHPLWLSRGIVENGFPSLNRQMFVEFPVPRFGRPVKLIDANWPLDRTKSHPGILSKASHLYNYGREQFMRYEATFKIQHMIFQTPHGKFAHIPSQTDRSALCIFDMALRVFVEDVKALVKAGVEKDIAAMRRAQEAPDFLPNGNIDTKQRERSLDDWLALEDHPLDYLYCNSFPKLTKALCSTREMLGKGLPGSDRNQISPDRFVQDIYNMGKPDNPSPPCAPINPKGSFLPVIKVALKFLSEFTVDEPHDAFAKRNLKMSLEYRAIRFIPWSAQENPANKKPVWNSWALLNQPATSFYPISRRNIEDLESIANRAMETAIASDKNASWNAGKIPLPDLWSVIDNVTLPTDWSIPRNSDGWIADTYSWFKQRYRRDHRVHHLAIIVGILLSHCLPALFPPHDAAHRLVSVDDSISRYGGPSLKSLQIETFGICQQMPWEERGRKGMIDRSIFITMISTFIAALYDSQSPLRVYMSGHRGSLGDWSKKHGQKGITPFLLIRVGILWGKGRRSVGGVYGTDWGLQGVEDIETLYQTLVEMLSKGRQFGPFDALYVLVGEKRAREVSAIEGLVVRSQMMSNKFYKELDEEPYPEERNERGWEEVANKRRRL